MRVCDSYVMFYKFIFEARDPLVSIKTDELSGSVACTQDFQMYSNAGAYVVAREVVCHRMEETCK